MPDGDVFTWTLVKGWRRPARITCAEASVEEVAPLVARALWRTLRESGGCPGLTDIAAVVRDVQRVQGEAPLLFLDPAESAKARKIAFERLRRIEEEFDRHKHTILATDVARAEIVKALHENSYSTRVDETGQSLAEGFCQAAIDHYLFDRQRPLLVGQRFRSYSEARLWEQSVLDAIGSNIAKIASGVLRDATGQSLSRPVFRRIHTRSTADLLNLVIVR